MATAPWRLDQPRTVFVEEYLETSYRPDCEFVDGIVEERNVGEYEHSRLQGFLTAYFIARERQWNIIALSECRLQIGPQRFRVPDLMVLHASQQVDRIVRDAPIVCIEVLSPEDTWTRMCARLNDYLALGVEHVWCFDPEAREARQYTAFGFTVVTEPVLAIPALGIGLPLAEVFAALDARKP